MATGLSICIGAILIYVGLWYIVLEIKTVADAIDGLTKRVLELETTVRLK